MEKQPSQIQKQNQEKEYEISAQTIGIIRLVIRTEKELEEIKVTLAENIRFDISIAFRSIDTNQKGYITPEDVFRFMINNGFNVTIKLCQFLVYCFTNGNKMLPYQQFLSMIIPRFDRDAAQTMIARKLFQEDDLMEEQVAKLFFSEIQYLEEVEIQKMRLAQMVDWKFMSVYKLISHPDPTKSVDKNMLANFFNRYNVQKLTDKEYAMFLKRFNRNEDKLFQREEFSDAIFPNGFLLQDQDKQQKQADFEDYVKNRNQALDNYLGKQLNVFEYEKIQFNPEEHKFKEQNTQPKSSIIEDIIRENQSKRLNMQQNLSQNISQFVLELPREKKSEQKEQTYQDKLHLHYDQYQSYGPSDPNSSLKYFGIDLNKGRSRVIPMGRNESNQRQQPQNNYSNDPPPSVKKPEFIKVSQPEPPQQTKENFLEKEDHLTKFLIKPTNSRSQSDYKWQQHSPQPSQEPIYHKPDPQFMKPEPGYKRPEQQYQNPQSHQINKPNQMTFHQDITKSQLEEYVRQPTNMELFRK